MGYFLKKNILPIGDHDPFNKFRYRFSIAHEYDRRASITSNLAQYNKLEISISVSTYYITSILRDGSRAWLSLQAQKLSPARTRIQAWLNLYIRTEPEGYELELKAEPKKRFAEPNRTIIFFLRVFGFSNLYKKKLDRAVGHKAQ